MSVTASLAHVGMRRRLHQLLPPTRAAIWLPLDDALIAGPEPSLLLHPETLLVSEVVDNITAVLGFRGTFTAYQLQLAGVPVIMNLSASTVRDEHTHKVLVATATDAVRVGAQAVAFHVNHTSPFEAEGMREMGRLASEAESFGLPLVAIAYPRGRHADGHDDNYLTLREQDEEAFTRLVKHCVRLAVDLGASAVKTVYTGSVQSFETVVSAAMGVPVLVAGGPYVDEGEAITKAQAAIKAGAAGVAYGRQVFERDQPGLFLKKLRNVLDGTKVATLSEDEKQRNQADLEARYRWAAEIVAGRRDPLDG